MPASVSDIFGGGASSTLFSATVSGGATEAQQAAQVTVEASKREINRIRGYKIQLTPAENKRLTEIQEEISKINDKAANGTVRSDEIEDRSALFLEADEIIGKPSAGVEIDDTLTDFREQIDDLLAPRLTPQQQDRLDILNKLKTNFEARLEDDNSNVVVIRQIQNVQRQIDTINVPRQISQLSVSEKQEYDALVEQANEHAGAKLLLNARESTRVQLLEETISQMSSLLPADTNQPTAADVARAYTRLG